MQVSIRTIEDAKFFGAITAASTELSDVGAGTERGFSGRAGSVCSYPQSHLSSPSLPDSDTKVSPC